MNVSHEELRETTADGNGAAQPPSLGELLRRLEELRPQLEAGIEAGDRDRKVPAEGIEALRDAELLRLLTPRRFGGFELGFRSSVEMAIALGRIDGSTAWVTNLGNGAAYLIGMMTDEAQHDVWSESPDVTSTACFNPSGTSRREGDNHIISGSWGWASGCHYASWALLNFFQYDENGAEIGPGFGLVPMSELTINDNWNAIGMRGTGSNALVGENIVVPQHRLLPWNPIFDGVYPSPHKDETLYRTPYGPALVALLIGPIIGIAEAALAHVIEKAPNRVLSGSGYKHQVDSVGFQVMLGEAAAHAETARTLVLDMAAEIDAAAGVGELISMNERARLRLKGVWGVKNAVDAIEILMSAYGASGFTETSPLQRMWRDANTAARHAGINLAISKEVYGKTLLDLDLSEVMPAAV